MWAFLKIGAPRDPKHTDRDSRGSLILFFCKDYPIYWQTEILFAGPLKLELTSADCT